jgi:hypothetical protein
LSSAINPAQLEKSTAEHTQLETDLTQSLYRDRNRADITAKYVNRKKNPGSFRNRQKQREQIVSDTRFSQDTGSRRWTWATRIVEEIRSENQKYHQVGSMVRQAETLRECNFEELQEDTSLRAEISTNEK